MLNRSIVAWLCSLCCEVEIGIIAASAYAVLLVVDRDPFKDLGLPNDDNA